MKKCIVIAGGSLQPSAFYQEAVKAADYVICADGGARHAKMLGIKPDLVVGDFDTLTERELAELKEQGVELLQYPSRKDCTDTEIALLKALELGYIQIDIIGALGGRLDHTLANVMILALPQARRARVRLVDEYQEVFLTDKKINLCGQKGETISLLPLSEVVSGITTKGLEYALSKGVFKMGNSVGISNVFCEDKAEVEIEKGLLLVLRIRK